MAPRAHWKGYLKLSLVSCPISLYPAIAASERLSFRKVNRETGNRLRQQLVDSVTGEVVEPQNKGRGYEVGEKQFLMVQDEELEAAQQEARTRAFISRSASRAPLAPSPMGRRQDAARPSRSRRRKSATRHAYQTQKTELTNYFRSSRSGLPPSVL